MVNFALKQVLKAQNRSRFAGLLFL